MWLSYIACAVVKIVTSSGPRFICKIKKGSTSIKTKVGFVNNVWSLVSISHYFVFLGVFILCVWILDWNAKNWIDSYFITLGWSISVTFGYWLIHNVIGYHIYTCFIHSFLLSGSATYELRYFHDQDKVLIPERKGRLAKKDEMVEQYSYHYLGLR
jgi:hypothetical protein